MLSKVIKRWYQNKLLDDMVADDTVDDMVAGDNHNHYCNMLDLLRLFLSFHPAEYSVQNSVSRKCTMRLNREY